MKLNIQHTNHNERRLKVEGGKLKESFGSELKKNFSQSDKSVRQLKKSVAMVKKARMAKRMKT